MKSEKSELYKFNYFDFMSILQLRGVDNFLRLGGANKVKDQRAAIRWVRKGDMPPPARSAEAKFFFKIQEV